ncbi:hypothetical protein ACQPZ8_37415 [Actinomadura nitritigenes]|uniref:hypothetical protein n=1 Tax=Actinomadura nitritigenes TaxID=134602 RepID=UPI003D90E547
MAQSMSPTQVIATSVRRLRTDYGWSAQRLADEMTAAGVKWDRMIVVNLEHGRRGTVDVAELLVLGRVFDVPPLSLLAPIGHDDVIEALPGQTMQPYDLWQWVTGKERPTWIASDSDGSRRWLDAVGTNIIYERWQDAEGSVLLAQRDVRRAEKIGDANRTQDARSRYFEALEVWAHVLTAIRRKGLVPPDFPDEWESEARDVGLLGEA